jgi:hypothetical protein
MAAIYALLYLRAIQCNLVAYWDSSHGCNRDFWLAASECGIKPFLMLCMVLVNLPHGPDLSDMRFAQLRDCLMDHFRKCTNATSPLFQHGLADMLREWGGAVEPREGQSYPECLWELLEEDCFLRKKGYKCNIGRYLAFVSDGKKLIHRWATRKFEISVACVEFNMVTKGVLGKVRLCSTGADIASNDKSTSASITSVAERTLKSCGLNAMCISLGLVNNDAHLRILAIHIGLAEPVKTWHSHASREQRDVVRNQAWLLEQARGGAIDHVYHVMDVLSNVDFLRQAKFLPTTSDILFLYTEEEVLFEDEMAERAGHFAMSLMKCRLRRLLYLVEGWPYMFIFDLGTAAEKGLMWKWFECDTGCFKALQDAPNKSELMRAYEGRSPFQMLAVEQVVRACREVGFQGHEDITAIIHASTLTTTSSQGVEDLNNHQKNSHQVRSWGGKFRRPETCLATTVRDQVLHKSHRFLPAPKVVMRVVAEPLPHDAFQRVGRAALPVHLMASTQQKAHFYSPQPENVGRSTADVKVLRELVPLNRLDLLEATWKSLFL